MESKVLSLLGFASRAGRLAFGADAAISALYAKKARLIIMSFEISAKSQKEIRFHSNKCGINAITLENTDILSLSHAVGRKCGVVAINDESFAEGILTTIGGNVNDK